MPYRTDPETGKTFFIDPTLMGCRTAEDEKFAKDDFIALVERRAGILAARRPLTARERDHNDYLLGYRAVAGKVFCIGCENRSRPDVEVDDQCGQPLQPLKSYQGVMPSDVVRCAYCNRMNTEKAKFCNSCANPINVKPSRASRRVRVLARRRRHSGASRSPRPRRAGSRPGIAAVRNATRRPRDIHLQDPGRSRVEGHEGDHVCREGQRSLCGETERVRVRLTERRPLEVGVKESAPPSLSPQTPSP